MLPNFLVVGTMKAGTTALHNSLAQHPQIFMSQIKEPFFFSYEGRRSKVPTIVTTIDAYRELFRGVTTEIAYGESSPGYLSSDDAPERIKHYIPNAKLVAILRNPVDRAYSHYWHEVQNGRARATDFLTAFERTVPPRADGKQKGNPYRSMGFYSQQLTRYYQFFEPKQLKIYLYEDWNAEPQVMLRDLFAFLGVDPTFEPANERYVRTGKPKSNLLYRLLRKPPAPLRRLARLLTPSRVIQRRRKLMLSLANQNIETPPPMTLNDRRVVLEVYRDDILALQDLIQRDLSAWLRADDAPRPNPR